MKQEGSFNRMFRFNSIKSRLIFFAAFSFISIAFSVSFSYFISVHEVKTIMRADVSSIADAMEKSLDYIARMNPEAYKDENFKKTFNSIKIGKTGYPFLLDGQGTLVVHKKDEGKNLAGLPHIDFIRNHKEGGVYEYTASTTGQDKLVAFRYIKPWKLWVVPGVNKDDYFNALRFSFLKWNLVLGAVIILMLTLISYWITVGITRPVRNAVGLANRLAEGDLTCVMTTEGNDNLKTGDEIDELNRALNGMVKSLNSMVGNVNHSAGELFLVAGNISDASGRVLGSAEIQAAAANNTSSAMTEINTSIKSVADNVDSVSQSAVENTSSILEMASSMEEMAQSVQAQSASIEEVSSSIIQMTVAVKQVKSNVSSLLDSVETTALSIAEMDGSIKQIEENASETASIVQGVSADAATGQDSVQAVIDGMNEIRQSSRITSQVVETLSQRAAAIGQILSVIDEVAGQTKLLALNAAIIASQAGEHGKGFSVVAEEIKKLAERTSNSTREIEAVIRGVQDETMKAVDVIGLVERKIEDGVILSRKSGDVLLKIVGGTEKASQRMGEIARATVEQGKGSGMIREAMEQVSDMVEQIARATAEHENGSEQIIEHVTKMKDLSARAKYSTVEQSKATAFVAKNSEEITAMMRQINRICEEQRFGGGQVMAAVADIQGSTSVNLESIHVMNEALSKLQGHTAMLKKEMAVFRI
jgi:methyl-accepting chemotaxis protein